jgi:flagellar motor switch protein FliM
LSEILSQSEIDALLSAISKGEIKAEEVKSKSIEKKIKQYDFKRPNKFSKEQLHTLSIIHENFARLLTTYLSAQLRTLVQVNVYYVEQMTYNEFISSLPNPSLISVVNFSPLKGAIIIEINPSVAFAIIDRLLGGAGEYKEKLREPTEIENGIIEKIFVKMTNILHEAWKDITDINATLEKMETNSQFIQLVAPNEAVALITFSVKVGKSEGMINICIPHIVIEPIISKLSTRIWLSNTKKEVSEKALQFLSSRISGMNVEIKAVLGKVQITIGEFLNLKLGDVITLDKNIGSEVDIFVQDNLKFKGIVGVYHNKMAVKIISLAAKEEETNG